MFEARSKKLGYVIAYKLGISEHTDIVFLDDQVKQIDENTYIIIDRRGGVTPLNKGDYVILDKEMFTPIPMREEDFNERYVHLVDNIYDEIPHTVKVWSLSQAMCDEIKFIRDVKGVYFNGFTFAWQYTKNGRKILETVPGDAYIIIHKAYYDDAGNVIDVDFEFVDNRLFNELYSVV